MVYFRAVGFLDEGTHRWTTLCRLRTHPRALRAQFRTRRLLFLKLCWLVTYELAKRVKRVSSEATCANVPWSFPAIAGLARYKLAPQRFPVTAGSATDPNCEKGGQDRSASTARLLVAASPPTRPDQAQVAWRNRRSIMKRWTEIAERD